MGEHDNTADEGSFGSGELSGDEIDMEEFSLEFDTFPVVLACFIVILNVMVIVMFIRNRSLRTVTNSFLVSLAVSDLLAGLVGIPLAITCTIFGRQQRLSAFCVNMAIYLSVHSSTYCPCLCGSLHCYKTRHKIPLHHDTKSVLCAHNPGVDLGHICDPYSTIMAPKC